MPQKIDLSLYRGDTETRIFRFAHSTVWDWANANWAMRIQPTLSRAPALDIPADAITVHSDADHVLVTINIPAVATQSVQWRQACYDLQAQWPDGRTKTPVCGNIILDGDITP